MKHTVYLFISDDRRGHDATVYTTKAEVQARKRETILESECEKAIALLESDFEEAWVEAEEYLRDCGDFYRVEEQEIELPAPKIIIDISGGLIQSIVTDTPGSPETIVFLDYDEHERERLQPIPQGDGTFEEAWVGVEYSDDYSKTDPAYVQQVLDAIHEHNAKNP